MDYSVKELENSSIEVSIKVDEELMKKYRGISLKEIWKDFEMPGFRKWHVPNSVVEQNIDIEQFIILIYENIVDDCFKTIHKSWEYEMIWDIYDMDQEEKDWILYILFKIDIFPKAIVKNNNWKKIKCKKLDVKVTDEEVEKVIKRMKEENSEYKDVEKTSVKIYVTIELKYKDKDGENILKSDIFIWEDTFEEFPMLKDIYIWYLWRKVGYEKKIKYSEDLPAPLIFSDDEEYDTDPERINTKIIAIEEQLLPVLTVENIKQRYWEKYEKIEDFEEKIKKDVYEKNRIKLLKETFENIFTKVKESIKALIPDLLLKKEVNDRIKWDEKLKMYFEIMWEEDKSGIYSIMKNESRSEFEEYFILEKYLEITWLKKEIDLEKEIHKEKNYILEEKVVEYVSKAKL